MSQDTKPKPIDRNAENIYQAVHRIRYSLSSYLRSLGKKEEEVDDVLFQFDSGMIFLDQIIHDIGLGEDYRRYVYSLAEDGFL